MEWHTIPISITVEYDTKYENLRNIICTIRVNRQVLKSFIIIFLMY